MNDNAKALYEDLLASRIKHFDMRFWHEALPDCGTACCIGGTAEARMKLAGLDVGGYSGKAATVGGWLGLDEDTADDLFYPADNSTNCKMRKSSAWYFGRFADSGDPFQATQPEAAEALKRACELSESK